jgi:hypothetical protein
MFLDKATHRGDANGTPGDDQGILRCALVMLAVGNAVAAC